MDVLKKVSIVIDLLKDMNKKIAFAESCTGGYVAHMFTNISGASDVFERAIVCYSNDSKIQLLNVDPNSIKGEGAVSETVAKQLAHNMRVLSNVDVGVGITGIAGPTGGTKDKPIGLVYVAFSTEHQLVTKRYQFETDRVDFKKKVLDAILETLESLLKSWSA